MVFKHILFMDYETFGLVDLKVVGVDNYIKDPGTGIHMLAWAVDTGETKLWLTHTGQPPAELAERLRDPETMIVAWNGGQFEYLVTNTILPRYMENCPSIPLSRYRDPIILAHALSLPGKLEKVAEILRMTNQKDPRGDALKQMFCLPVSKGGEVTLFGISPPLFRTHESHPKEFAEFGKYCIQDNKTQQELWYKLVKIPFSEIEWLGWMLDQKINGFGIPGNRDLAEKGLRLALEFVRRQRKLLKEKTGLENPNSDTQMKAWAQARGYPWNSLRAPTVAAELKNPDSKITPECREALKLRASARKSSYTKIERFLAMMGADDRLRYQFRYMGAARTGRWASGGGENSSVQVQNFPRGEKAVKKKLDVALKLLAAEDYDGIEKEFGTGKNPITVMEFVTTLLRSLFQAKPGKKIVVADKNAIENRVLGWVAGCKAILDVFRTCNDCGFLDESSPVPFCCSKCGSHEPRCPYLSFGTKLFDKPYQQMAAERKAGNEDDRQNSKPAVLGAGYGLGGGEMFTNEYKDEVRGGLWGYAKNVCGVDMPKELAHKAVKIFRDSYPEVVQLWTDLEEAFKQVLLRGGVIRVGQVTWDKENEEWIEHPTQGKQCVLTFRRIDMGNGNYTIRMELPSGRALHYLNATIDEEQKVSKRTGRPYTVQVLHYDGIEHSATTDAAGKTQKKRHIWGRVKTYGGKICENAVQAISRDDLLNSMFLADEMGFDIWGLFHDELACEVDDNPGFDLQLGDLIWCMTQVPSWAPGLILGAEGYESYVYKKG